MDDPLCICSLLFYLVGVAYIQSHESVQDTFISRLLIHVNLFLAGFCHLRPLCATARAALATVVVAISLVSKKVQAWTGRCPYVRGRLILCCLRVISRDFPSLHCTPVFSIKFEFCGGGSGGSTFLKLWRIIVWYIEYTSDEESSQLVHLQKWITMELLTKVSWTDSWLWI